MCNRVAVRGRGAKSANDLPKVLRFSIDIKSLVSGIPSDDDVDFEK